MTDEEQIKEMTDKIQLYRKGICLDGVEGWVRCSEKEIAETLYNEGYRRIIWHKVEDGDLPEDCQEVRFVSDTHRCVNGVYCKEPNAFYHDADIKYNIDEVIAWTELPEYKE